MQARVRDLLALPLAAAILLFPLGNALGVTTSTDLPAPTADTTLDPLGLAQRLLDLQRATAEDILGAEILPALDQQERNLALSRDLLTMAAESEGGLGGAIAMAKRATAWQAETLGVEIPPFASIPHETLQDSVGGLLALYGAELGPQELQALARLEAFPDGLQAALRDMVDAFSGIELASRQAWSLGEPAERGLGIVLAARNQLLDATQILKEELATPQVMMVNPGICQFPFPSTSLNLHIDIGCSENSTGNAPPISGSFILSIDLGGNDEYTSGAHVRFAIDADGNDTYRNNAGGNNFDGLLGCEDSAVGLSINASSTALVDLQSGADRYASPSLRCGTNGGASLAGTGFLLDDGGNDVYEAPLGHGANGGGNNLAVGFLLDGGGNDRYLAGGDAVNGGGRTSGAGFLLDAGVGADEYAASADRGTNGGASFGFFRVTGVNDPSGNPVNFPGESVGFLFDVAGDDRYNAMHFGTNGGGVLDSAGFLLDGAGNDTYSAGGNGTNGGAAQTLATGFLLDATGRDVYNATTIGTNGGADGQTGVASMGALVDLSGNDTYNGGNTGTNGGGVRRTVGLLVDVVGQDVYDAAGTVSTNGGSTGSANPGVGLLFDGADFDIFREGTPEDICTDFSPLNPAGCIVLPKSNLATPAFGAQVDFDTCRATFSAFVCDDPCSIAISDFVCERVDP